MKVQDIVRTAVDKMREATQIPINQNPVKAVELLTENKRSNNSRYGLVNAVTSAFEHRSFQRSDRLRIHFRLRRFTMSSVFNCITYDDINSTIRLDGHVVYLNLEDEGKSLSIHLTLNPFQVRPLAKYLAVALTQIDFADMRDENHFGDLSVRIEQDTLRAS